MYVFPWNFRKNGSEVEVEMFCGALPEGCAARSRPGGGQSYWSAGHPQESEVLLGSGRPPTTHRPRLRGAAPLRAGRLRHPVSGVGVASRAQARRAGVGPVSDRKSVV